jgi:hypothetical protein
MDKFHFEFQFSGSSHTAECNEIHQTEKTEYHIRPVDIRLERMFGTSVITMQHGELSVLTHHHDQNYDAAVLAGLRGHLNNRVKG